MTMMRHLVLLAQLLCCLVALSAALPPNYDDIEETADSPVGQTVNIDQADPQSNAIHVAHNIPTGSKVSIEITTPPSEKTFLRSSA